MSFLTIQALRRSQKKFIILTKEDIDESPVTTYVRRTLCKLYLQWLGKEKVVKGEIVSFLYYYLPEWRHRVRCRSGWVTLHAAERSY